MAVYHILYSVVIYFLVTFTAALQVAPGSPCSSVCTTDPKNTSINGTDITCSDSDYGSAKGEKFKRCMGCLQTSSFGNEKENDQRWFLYNLRYAVDWCLFGFPNNPSPLSGPCITTTSCGLMIPALEAGNLAADSGTALDYCTASPRDFAADVDKCNLCMQQMIGAVFLSNFLIALKAGCQQHPSQSTLIGLDATVFSPVAVNITAAATSTSTSSSISNGSSTPGDSGSSGGIGIGTKIGIAVGVVAFALLCLAIYIIQHYKRRSSLRKKLGTNYHPRFGTTEISGPVSGAYAAYNVAAVTPTLAWDDKHSPNLERTMTAHTNITNQTGSTEYSYEKMEYPSPPPSAHVKGSPNIGSIASRPHVAQSPIEPQTTQGPLALDTQTLPLRTTTTLSPTRPSLTLRPALQALQAQPASSTAKWPPSPITRAQHGSTLPSPSTQTRNPQNWPVPATPLSPQLQILPTQPSSPMTFYPTPSSSTSPNSPPAQSPLSYLPSGNGGQAQRGLYWPALQNQQRGQIQALPVYNPANYAATNTTTTLTQAASAVYASSPGGYGAVSPGGLGGLATMNSAVPRGTSYTVQYTPQSSPSIVQAGAVGQGIVHTISTTTSPMPVQVIQQQAQAQQQVQPQPAPGNSHISRSASILTSLRLPGLSESRTGVRSDSRGPDGRSESRSRFRSESRNGFRGDRGESREPEGRRRMLVDDALGVTAGNVKREVGSPDSVKSVEQWPGSM